MTELKILETDSTMQINSATGWAVEVIPAKWPNWWWRMWAFLLLGFRYKKL